MPSQVRLEKRLASFYYPLGVGNALAVSTAPRAKVVVAMVDDDGEW